MMEKDLIKKWAKEWVEDDLEALEKLMKLEKVEKEVTDSSAKFVYHFKEKNGAKTVRTTQWLHELYKKAKGEIEDENWAIHFTYSLDSTIFFIIKHKTVDNLFYQGMFRDERKLGESFHLTLVAVMYKDMDAYLLSSLDVPELKLKAFKDKKKQVMNFLYNWCLENHEDRLLILTGSEHIVEEEYDDEGI